MVLTRMRHFTKAKLVYQAGQWLLVPAADPSTGSAVLLFEVNTPSSQREGEEAFPACATGALLHLCSFPLLNYLPHSKGNILPNHSKDEELVQVCEVLCNSGWKNSAEELVHNTSGF